MSIFVELLIALGKTAVNMYCENKIGDKPFSNPNEGLEKKRKEIKARHDAFNNWQNNNKH